MFIQTAKLGNHLPGADRAVQPERVDFHPLHDLQDCHHIRSAQRATFCVTCKGDKDRFPADTAHGKNRSTRFGQSHHRFDHKQIHACFLKGCGLLRIDLHQFLKRDVSQRREKMPGRSNVPRDQSFPRGCITGQRNQTEVEILHRMR